MHARGRACHWCPERAAGSWRSPAIGIAAAAVLAAGIGGTSWQYRSEIGAAYSRVVQPAEAAPVPVATVALAAHKPESREAGAVTPAFDSAAVKLPGAVAPAVASAPAPDAFPADTVQWVPAVARTWVNVRNEAGRENQVVGVIRTGSRALLGGTGRAGWRQVRSDSTIGWVNPKHFDVDSVRTRG